jgi:hypothetical protein
MSDDIQKVQKRVVNMPSMGGLYIVSFSALNGVLLIERESNVTGRQRVVWSASMRKEIGKRLTTVAKLAGAIP